MTLCSARGARDGPVAEWIVGALLGVSARPLEFAYRREWERGREIDDLESWTVLIVGMGSIGNRVAELLASFRTRVVGVVSHARDGLHGIDELAALLINAARRPVVDRDALLAEVSTGRLRAVLDVTDPEPLPADNEVWTAPRGAVHHPAFRRWLAAGRQACRRARR